MKPNRGGSKMRALPHRPSSAVFEKANGVTRAAMLRRELGTIFDGVHPLHRPLAERQLRELAMRRDLSYNAALGLAEEICAPYEDLPINYRVRRLLAVLGMEQKILFPHGPELILLDSLPLRNLSFEEALAFARTAIMYR